MSGGDLVLVPVLVAIVMALIEIIKAMISKRNSNGMSRKELECHKALDIINRKDINGYPLVYTPPELIATQKEVVEILKELSHQNFDLFYRHNLLVRDLLGICDICKDKVNCQLYKQLHYSFDKYMDDYGFERLQRKR